MYCYTGILKSLPWFIKSEAGLKSILQKQFLTTFKVKPKNFILCIRKHIQKQIREFFGQFPSKLMKIHISKAYAYRTSTEKNPRPFLVAPSLQLVPPPSSLHLAQTSLYLLHREKKDKEKESRMVAILLLCWLGGREYGNHRLNMKLYLQRLFGLLFTAVLIG